MVAASTSAEREQKRIAQFVKLATDEMKRQAGAAKEAANTAPYEKVATAAKKAAESHAGAQREVLVLAHELSQGNYSRFGGSLLVIGEQLNVMAKLATPAGAAIGALVAVVGGAAALMAMGAIEADKYAKAMQLTGNYAAVSEEQIAHLAQAQAMLTGQTVGGARGSVEAAASSGLFSAAEVAVAARAMGDYQRLTRATSEEALKNFQSIQDGVAKWSAEQNRSVHFLTAAEYDHIKSLEESGQKEKAAVEALKLYATTIESRGTPALGGLARAWNAVKDAASSAAQAIESVGRGSGANDKLEDLRSQLDELTRKGPRGSSPDMSEVMGRGRTRGDQVASLQRQIVALENVARVEKLAAAAAAQRASINQQYIDGKSYEDGLLRQAHAINARTEALAKWDARRDLDAKAGQPMMPATYQSGRAQIMKEFASQPNDASMNAYRSLIADIDAFNQRVALETDQQSKLSESQTFAIEQHKRLADATKNLTAAQRADVEARAAVAEANGRAAERAKDYKTLTDAIQKYNEETRVQTGQQKALTEAQKWAAGQHQAIANMRSLSPLDRAGADMAIDQGAADREFADRADAVKKYAQGLMDAEAQARSLIGVTADQADEARKMQGLDNVIGHALLGTDNETAKRLMDFAATLRGPVVDSINQTKAAADAFNASFSAGWIASVKEFEKQAGDNAANAKRLFDDMANGMTNAIVQFATTGKFSFKSLADSIVQDLIRIQAQKAIAGVFGGGSIGSLFDTKQGAAGAAGSGSLVDLFTGTFGGGFYANGLDYVPYDGFPAVLHEGEKVVRRQDAAAQRKDGTGVTIHMGAMTFGAGVDASGVAQAVRTGMNQVKGEIQRSLATNGRFA